MKKKYKKLKKTVDKRKHAAYNKAVNKHKAQANKRRKRTLTSAKRKGKADKMKSYTLKATTQKSYYGKAVVIEDGGEKMLKSYNTIVCKIDANGNFIKCWNGYSRTTQNHINDFRRLNGLSPMNKREWMNAKSENGGERWQVTFSNGFVKWTAGVIFDNEDDAYNFADDITERNYRIGASVKQIG